MDEYTADAFANRDEPLPLLTVTYSDVDVSSTESEIESTSKRARFRRSISGLKLRDKFEGKAQEIHDERRARTPPGQKPSIQDRLFTKLLQQVIPTDDYESPGDEKVDRRSSKYVARPSFSLPVMTNNFRRFNARIGIVFVFQNQMIRLFGWRTATHTLSFLAVYTFVCLNPYLLVALPLAIAILFIMIPAFMSRHPPPPRSVITSASNSRSDPFSAYSYSGPPLAPARTIKPAAETSKDFFRNMRDLQNSMSDFSNLHDILVTTVAPATNFSDEILSSTIFLYLTILTCVLFISAHLLPWRLIFLVGGYAMTISGHPQVQTWMIKRKKKSELQSSNLTPEQRKMSLNGLLPVVPSQHNPTLQRVQNTLSSLSEITLSTTPQSREVEIFELQHRPLLPSTNFSASLSPANKEVLEWTPHLFTPTPYDPLSPTRISGDRPRGTRFFEDVKPPSGWEWGSKKWELDLEAGEWVNDRLIVGVEYDVVTPMGGRNNDKDDYYEEQDESDHEDEEIGAGDEETFDQSRKRKQSMNADFGGWVWDLPPAVGTTGNRDEEVWLAYGDYDVPSFKGSSHYYPQDTPKSSQQGKSGKDGNKKGGSNVVNKAGKDWEENTRFGNKERTGEWRRRRWVRVVRRVGVGGGSDEVNRG